MAYKAHYLFVKKKKRKKNIIIYLKIDISGFHTHPEYLFTKTWIRRRKSKPRDESIIVIHVRLFLGKCLYSRELIWDHKQQ